MTKCTLENAHRLSSAHYDPEVHNDPEVHSPNGELLPHRFSVIDGGLAKGKLTPWLPGPTRLGSSHATVEISPPEFIRRRVIECPGLTAESVQTASHTRVEYSFHGATHLLVIYEDGARSDGQTCVQGLPLAFRPATNITNGTSFGDSRASCISTSILTNSLPQMLAASKYCLPRECFLRTRVCGTPQLSCKN